MSRSKKSSPANKTASTRKSSSRKRTVNTRKKKRNIEQYDHRDKERVNNPPVGLVTEKTDLDAASKTYRYDPHIDLDKSGSVEEIASHGIVFKLYNL